ncbi:MAG: hypothetical protein AAB215_01365, partial [Planctomycetota bacterium]
AAGRDFGGKAKAFEAAISAVQEPAACAAVAREFLLALRGAGAEGAHAWAAARFQGGAASGEGTQALAALKAALQGETDPAARASLVAKAAGSIREVREKTEWARMLSGEVGKMKPDDLAAWFSKNPSPAPPPPPPPADGKAQPADGKEPPKTPAAAEGLDENGFPLPVPGEADDEPYEGFGANKGGRGGPIVEVEASAAAITAALNRGDLNGAILKLKPGDYDGVRGKSTFKNVTVDGGSATLWRPNWEMNGQNVVIRNLRLRNSNDNISMKAPCDRITLAHVTTTGSMDVGMSIAYGTKNATVQYCFFGGNTRSTFIKYDADRISYHHNWLIKQWIRGPLIHAQIADVRNNVQEDWWNWGGPNFTGGSNGNAVNNVYITNGWSPSKVDATAYAYKNGKGVVYIAGTLAIGFKPILARSDSDKPLPTPKTTTHTGEEALKIVKEKAGCRPLDAVDLKIIAIDKWAIGDLKPFRPMIREGGKTVEGPISMPDMATFKPGPKVPPPNLVAGQRGKFAQIADPKTVPHVPDPAAIAPPDGGEKPGGEEGGEGEE